MELGRDQVSRDDLDRAEVALPHLAGEAVLDLLRAVLEEVLSHLGLEEDLLPLGLEEDLLHLGLEEDLLHLGPGAEKEERGRGLDHLPRLVERPQLHRSNS